MQTSTLFWNRRLSCRRLLLSFADKTLKQENVHPMLLQALICRSSISTYILSSISLDSNFLMAILPCFPLLSISSIPHSYSSFASQNFRCKLVCCFFLNFLGHMKESYTFQGPFVALNSSNWSSSKKERQLFKTNGVSIQAQQIHVADTLTKLIWRMCKKSFSKTYDSSLQFLTITVEL